MTLKHLSKAWAFGQRALGFLNGNSTLDTVRKVLVFGSFNVRIFNQSD